MAGDAPPDPRGHAGPDTVSAPGKLLLFGEYAVLDGAEAVVVAVDRWAHCRRTPTDDAVTVAGLGFGAVRWSPGGGVAAPGPEGDLPFARALLARTPRPRPGHYQLDTAAFQSTDPSAPGKLGLGSSAATTVALARALDSAADAATIFARAHGAHRAVQGSGSGADIAASTFGGAIAYRWWGPERAGETPDWAGARQGTTVVAVEGGRAAVTPLPGLVGRRLQLAWSGSAASTPSLVGQVDAWARRDPGAHRAAMHALAAAAEAGKAALVANDGTALVAAAAAGRQALVALGSHASAPLVPPHLEALQGVVARHGGVAKPTGAGGGDLVWLVGRDPAHEQRLASEAEGAGFATLVLTVR